MRSSLPPLLIVGLPSWKKDYVKSTLLLCTELAREFDLLYVEYPYTWKDVGSALLGRGEVPYKRMLGLEARLRNIETYHGASLSVLTLPPSIPVNWIKNKSAFEKGARLNAAMARKAILQVMRKLKMAHPIMVNAFNPFLGNFLHGQMGESLSVYYAYDEISHASWAGKHGKPLEDKLLTQVDALICSSLPIQENRRHLQDRTFVVKNGVYFENFSPAIAQRREREADAPLTLGYWGVIDRRIDLDLLLTCLEGLPQVQLALVGPVREDIKDHPLFLHPRVEMSGPQPPKLLASFAAKMDLGLIPFVKNSFTQGIYPMKINEYLAAGLPVLSTNFGDLSDFSHIIEIAEDSAEFMRKLGTMLKNDWQEGLDDRLTLARSNSWQQRGKDFAQILLHLWSEGRHPAGPQVQLNAQTHD